MSKRKPNPPGAKGQGKTVFPKFDLKSLGLQHEISTRLGTLQVSPASFSDWVVFQDADEKDRLNPESFARLLTHQTVTRGEKDDKLSEDEVKQLLAEPEFLERLVTAHPDLYTEFADAPDVGDRGAREKKRERAEIVVRALDEPPAEFLLRAWREQEKRLGDRFKHIGEVMRKGFSGLSSTLSSSGFDALEASMSASERLRETLEKATFKGDPYRSVMDSAPRRFETIQPPPNPIYETNRRLGHLVNSIAEMRDLAIQTAEMQRGLNQVATEILDKFVVGSKAAEESSTKNLGIAKIAMAAAVASVFLTLLVSIFQFATSAPTKADVEAQRQIDRIARQSLHESARQNDLLEQELQIQETALEEARLRDRAARSVEQPKH